jgi:hypothetical protein
MLGNRSALAFVNAFEIDYATSCRHKNSSRLRSEETVHKSHSRPGLRSVTIETAQNENCGRVVELADTQDLKSCVAKAACGFEPRLGHYFHIGMMPFFPAAREQ